MDISQREQQLSESPIRPLVLKFSIPAIIGMLVNALYNVVDRYWIGQLNDVNAMSGIGLTAPFSNILLGFMMLVGIGATATISIRLGERRKADAEVVLANALTLCLLVGTSLSLIGLVFVRPIMVAFGASPATLPFAEDYIRIILMGNVFNTISFAMNHTIRGGGFPRRSAATQMLGAGLNVILDPLFIFGFGMGVKGAAIATIISQFVSMVWVLSFYYRGTGLIKLHRSNMRLQASTVRQIFSIGVSPFSMQIATSLVIVLANRALKAHGGDMAIGAMTVISSMTILIMMPVFGINQGLQPILGYNYGARHFERVKAAWLYGVQLATAIVVAGFLMIQVFPQVIIRIFIRNDELIQIGTTGIRLYLMMLPLLGFQVISTVYFSSVGKARVSLFLSMLRQVILLVPLYLILPEIFGLTGIWFANPIADLTSTVVTAWLILREMKDLNGLIRMSGQPR